MQDLYLSLFVMYTSFIAVHIGAGYHSPSREREYLKLMDEACRVGMEMVKNKEKSINVLVSTIQHLEASPLTNAGVGSNLAFNGEVTTDASLMDGNGTFGSVHCKGFSSPINQALKIYENEEKRVGKMGLVSPMLVVGDVGTDKLETTEQTQKWKKYKQLLEDSNDFHQHKSKKIKLEIEENEEDILNDTVGAILIDNQGFVYAGVSSGGIWLKNPGRIGEAAHYGSGIWASSLSPNTSLPIVISTTGTGEQIMKTLFASSLSQILSSKNIDAVEIPDTIKSFLTNRFINHPWLSAYPDKSVGFICYRSQEILKDDSKNTIGGEFMFAHTTKSMGVGYMSVNDTKPRVSISRKRENSPYSVFFTCIK